LSSDDEIDFNNVLSKLSKDELRVVKYFITYRSVGELLAIRELRGLYGIKDPGKVIMKLIDLGILERGVGCYNISRRFLNYVRSKGGNLLRS